MDKKTYNPYEEMNAFYKLDTPTAEDQFRFVEAMEYLIKTTRNKNDKEAFSFNLAMYYRDIKEFRLEKKYLEICSDLNSSPGKEQLGLIWYYGLDGEQSYEKAFSYFEECNTRCGMYMKADMYRYGQFVKKDYKKSRGMIENLFAQVWPEREEPLFVTSTLFPEVALRLVQYFLEEREELELGCFIITDARDILAIRQQRRPFWGNIRTMRKIVESMAQIFESQYVYQDIYDLFLFERSNTSLSFDYNDVKFKLDIFKYEGEIIVQFNDKWFHGVDDFFEKARINNQRITTVYDSISNIDWQ